MRSINPYLNFTGECEAAFNFYKSVFGGDFVQMSRYKDMPPAEDREAMDIDGDLIMHVSLPISKESILMGSDAGGEWAKHTVTGNNVQLSLSVDSQEEADRIFSALGAGGLAKMPMEKTFWGSYFGMLTDKFGINWMISYDFNRPQ